MKTTRLLILFILTLSVQESFSQKIKYKDIFPLIENKDYDAAIPKINAFLNDEKNADHANAHLQKGLYFEMQSEGYHILSDSTLLLQTADSAKHLLAKAKSLITEKEIKKNNEYYQAFYRRDLRTGEFGIKLSDVHLDIEKKIEALDNLLKYAKIIHTNLRIADRKYKQSNEQYKHLATLYQNENDFALIAGDQEMQALQQMIEGTDSIRVAIDNVRDAVSKLGRKGYSPEINFKEIEQFGVDGMAESDFYLNDIEAWNYLSWAEALQKKIRVDVNRLNDKLSSTYDELKSTYDLVKAGGDVPASNLKTNIDPTLLKQLKSLDSNPLPEKLFNILIDHTRFEYITSKKHNPKLEDEADINYQLHITDSINTLIDKVTTQATALVEPYTTEGAKKYANLVENYGGDFGLIKYRKKIEEQFSTEKNKWKELQNYWKEKSLWGISEDAADSIYLVARTDSSYTAMELSKFYTLAITEDDSSNIFALGIEFTGDKDQGYLAKIGNNRIIQWKVNFSLGKFEYDDEVLKVNGAYAPADKDEIGAYIYSSVPESKTNFILLNCSRTGELNWATGVKINNEPVSINFNDIVKETNVFLMDEAAIETYEGDDPIYIVFDRKGNKVR